MKGFVADLSHSYDQIKEKKLSSVRHDRKIYRN